jgi:hypothetical protein
MRPAVLDQRTGIEIAGGVIVGGQGHRASLVHLAALRRREPLRQQLFGEIRRRGNADKPGDSLRACHRREQHDPAAHARSYEDLGPLGQRIEDGDRVIAPAADCGLGEAAARFAMPEIVEPDIGVAAPTTVFL